VKDKTVFKGGLNLKFFTDPNLESLKGVPESLQPSIISRNALRILTMGWTEAWKDLISWTSFKAIFWQRNSVFTKELRFAFQQGFLTLFSQLSELELTVEQKEQVQLYISNCLCFLPYSDLTPYESIKIPQCVEEEWVLVDYYITPLELTATKRPGKYIFQENDRVFAYGLEPIANLKAESHLIFMGTTYPAGQGFVTQINSDFKGFTTVGTTLYLSGRKNIKEWLVKQQDKVHVCGVSLGGSLSLILAIDLGNYISRVDALNPAGLHNYWQKHWLDHWDNFAVKPQVVVQQQANDPVSLYGSWKNDWQILHVIPPPEKKGPNAFCDHFLNYAGFAETQFTYLATEEDNAKRKFRNFWVYSVGRSFIFFVGVLPYTYLIRPMAYFFHDYAKSIGLVLLGSLISGAIIGLSFATMFSLSIALMMLSIVWGIIGGLLIALCSSGNSPVTQVHANLHNPALPRNPSMDTYNEAEQIDISLRDEEVRAYCNVMEDLKRESGLLPLIDVPYAENDSKLVTVKLTKAKAVYMKHSLMFINQLSEKDPIELKRAIKAEYETYFKGCI